MLVTVFNHQDKTPTTRLCVFLPTGGIEQTFLGYKFISTVDAEARKAGQSAFAFCPALLFQAVE